MIKIHADALATGPVAYHEFLLCYKETAQEVYGIVEGKEDPMFYRGLIEKFLPAGWEVELIKSGNKENVLTALNTFDWHRFEKKRIGFFVDRDLSFFLGENMTVNTSNLYITDNYSIESEAAIFGVFKRIIREIFNVTDLNNKEIQKLEFLFNRNLTLYKEVMAPIMAQVILWKRDHKKPCLNNIKLKEIFYFEKGSIFIKQEFESIHERVKYVANCLNLMPSTKADIEKAEKEFRLQKGVERFIRGKYMLWFLIEYAIQFHSSIQTIFPRYDKLPKINQTLGHKNGMVNVAPRMRCPDSLKTFIENNYMLYINSHEVSSCKCSS